MKPGTFEKGNKKSRGRPAGVPNKASTEFRMAVNNLLNHGAPKMIEWLDAVANGNPAAKVKPDPGKALDMMAKLAEYAAPKLSRVEHAGDEASPVRTVTRIELVGFSNANNDA